MEPIDGCTPSVVIISSYRSIDWRIILVVSSVLSAITQLIILSTRVCFQNSALYIQTPAVEEGVPVVPWVAAHRALRKPATRARRRWCRSSRGPTPSASPPVTLLLRTPVAGRGLVTGSMASAVAGSGGSGASFRHHRWPADRRFSRPMVGAGLIEEGKLLEYPFSIKQILIKIRCGYTNLVLPNTFLCELFDTSRYFHRWIS
jgi:hypothetical protein